MYRSFLRPLLFRLPAEPAHHLGLWGLSMLDTVPSIARRLRGEVERHPVEIAGLHFPNRVGLAAGLDKNAEALTGLFALGFGFVEVGTVTPRPQPGNEQPRLFRIPEHEALINRMGFNNLGADAMAARLREQTWRPGPIGVNLGKNKDTPLEGAARDYQLGAEKLGALADYLVVNLSSPNTPGLRSLQEPKALTEILTATRRATPKPVFLKISPDLTDEAIDEVVSVAQGCGMAGLICTNTTLARPFPHPEAGGLSGRPVAQRSTEVIRRAHTKSQGSLPIIGVGGIFSAADAREKLDAGASLIQLYTGFIYGGPALVRELVDTLA